MKNKFIAAFLVLMPGTGVSFAGNSMPQSALQAAERPIGGEVLSALNTVIRA